MVAAVGTSAPITSIVQGCPGTGNTIVTFLLLDGIRGYENAGCDRKTRCSPSTSCPITVNGCSGSGWARVFRSSRCAEHLRAFVR